MALATNMKSWLRGLFGTHNSSSVDVEAEVGQLFKHSVTYEISGDTNAATNVAVEYFWTAETACKIVGCTLLGDAAATANSANYATLNLQSGDGAATSAVTVGTVATTVAGGGNIAVGIPYDFTISTAALTAGQVLGLAIVKEGIGVDLPTGRLVVTLEET